MLTMFIVFRLQRYCYFMTLAIGFEEYFDELKCVKLIFVVRRRPMRFMRFISILQIAKFFYIKFLYYILLQ